MWFLGGFSRILRGFWRLIVGLIIGAILYVWMFFSYKDMWQDIHHKTTAFMDWLVSQPMLTEYSQWNTLLNLDDKLTFALFIMAGRIIWLLVESTLFSFPYWLFFGRHKKRRQKEALAMAAAGVAGGGMVAAKTHAYQPPAQTRPAEVVPPVTHVAQVQAQVAEPVVQEVAQVQAQVAEPVVQVQDQVQEVVIPATKTAPAPQTHSLASAAGADGIAATIAAAAAAEAVSKKISDQFAAQKVEARDVAKEIVARESEAPVGETLVSEPEPEDAAAMVPVATVVKAELAPVATVVKAELGGVADQLSSGVEKLSAEAGSVTPDLQATLDKLGHIGSKGSSSS